MDVDFDEVMDVFYAVLEQNKKKIKKLQNPLLRRLI